MYITYEHEQNLYLMAKACNQKEKSLLCEAYYLIDEDPDKYGLVDMSEAILSASIYYHISKSIIGIENKIIVDCGCHIGLQQLFFKEAKKYIGIDLSDNFFKICDNTQFIHGDIIEVLPTLDLQDSIGISVLCASCFPEVNNIMKQYFNKLVII